MGKHEILSQLVCVRLEAHFCSGKARLRIEDLDGVAKSQVPPKELASLGSKWVIDKSEIQVFRTIVDRADDLCRRYATRFMDVLYAFNEETLKTILPQIDDCISEFNAARDALANRVHLAQEDWKQKNPDWEHIINQSTLTRDDVLKRFSFTRYIVRVGAVEGDLEHGVDEACNALATNLFREIADKAESVYEESFEGRDRVTQRALRGIRASEEKLRSLTFIDPRIRPVLNRIKTSLDALPSAGVIEGNDLNAVMGLLQLMMDSDRMMSFGEKALSSRDEDEDVDTSHTQDQVPLVLPEPVAPQGASTELQGYF